MIFPKFCCLISVILTASAAFSEQKKPSVVVIGAGLAGLTTAYRLQQRGIEVHVYEARSRVGGRILSAKIGDEVVELGGQNIVDGGKAENLYRLIDELQLELTMNRMSTEHQYFDGEKLIPRQDLKRKLDPEDLKSRLNEAVSKSQNMQEVLGAIVEQDDPLYKTLSTRLAGYDGAGLERLSPLYARTLFYMLFESYISASVAGAEQEDGFVDFISVQGGNSLLAEKLAESLKGRVHLNMPLAAVSKAHDDSYELIFANGKKVKATVLVLAVPCSVYCDIDFDENVIPKDKLQAIESLHYGTNAKILVPFSQRPENAIPCFSDRVGCFFMDPKVLTLYCINEASRFSEDTILKTYRQERSMLERKFGNLDSFSVAPTFARDELFAQYEGPVGYSWPNDRYVKGSYLYVSPGQETLLTDTHVENDELVRTLFAPINQSLFFAGEHASILLEVPGTMESACESGERTARMVEKYCSRRQSM